MAFDLVRYPCKRKYPDNPTREVFESAKSGDAVALDEILQQMHVSQRALALETKTAHDRFKLRLHMKQRGLSAESGGESTPLIVAAGYGNLDCVKVLLKYKADVESRGHLNVFAGKKHCTFPLVTAAANGHVEVLQCLVENGADVNAQTNDNCTPLMTACLNGQVDAVAFLLRQGANIGLQDKTGNTALHYATCHEQDTGRVIGCLIESGADVNARSNNNSTPLMLASSRGHLKIAAVLTEYGANIDLQSKSGNTALHFAVTRNSSDVVHELLSLKASHLYNSQRLTPLLLASNTCIIPMVEYLINRPEYTKEQRIDALELLGASIATQKFSNQHQLRQGYEYMKRGMTKRFQDPSNPLLKQPMALVEAYQNRKESQTLEELAEIEDDEDVIIMESLVIRERILGTDNMELIDRIQNVAHVKEREGNYAFCIGLLRHAMNIMQHCNKSDVAMQCLSNFICVFHKMVQRELSPRQEDIFDIIEKTMVEYEKQVEKLQGEDEKEQPGQHLWAFLLYSLWKLLKLLVNLDTEHDEEDKKSCLSVLLQKLFRLKPCDDQGNTLVHMAAQGKTDRVLRLRFPTFRMPLYMYSEPCVQTMKLLLNSGFSVNVVNNNGDTPLHRAVTFEPSNDVEIHLLTDMLKVLFDAGAHLDFVNNVGKTATDLAQTDEARRILSEKQTLDLKCIGARAVKKFGVAYVGVVPKTLEKFISMH